MNILGVVSDIIIVSAEDKKRPKKTQNLTEKLNE